MTENARLLQTILRQSKRVAFPSAALLVLLAGLSSLATAKRPASAGEAEAAPQGQRKFSPELSQDRTKDGGLVLLTLRVDPSVQSQIVETELQAQFGEYRFPFFPGEAQGTYVAVIGVPHGYVPGAHEIAIQGLPAQAEPPELKVSLVVEEGKYRSEVLKVSPKHVNPPKKVLARIMAEQAEIAEIYREILREKLWKGPFVLPIQSPVTSPYGSQRLYNGKKQSFHQGLDLKAAVGTPIVAPSDGIVVLAKDLYFTGFTVILNHGYGLFTVYGHMSKLEVKKGERVSTGTLLGLAGMTGRSSGPHLHWGAIVQKIKVDPMTLVEVLR